MTPRDTEVTAAILADWLSAPGAPVSRYAAKRRMLAIAKVRPDIIHRRGRTIWALASELAPYIPALRDTPLHRTIRSLERRVVELEARVKVLAEFLPPRARATLQGK